MDKAAILERLDKMTRQKQALLAQVSVLDPQILKAKPSPDKWSILDVVEHLVLAEYHVFSGLPEAGKVKERKRTFSGLLFYYMVLFILRYRIPVQVPAKDMAPSSKRSLPELTEMWDKSHVWLRNYLSGLDKAGLKRAVFTHPASGPMTPKQMILMMEAHMNRHIPQIEALL